MKREFIMTPEFDKNWSMLGLDDHHLRKLQNEILLDPESGKLIQGTGGLRKLRFALDDGKSGGARVLYVDFCVHEKVYLITAYAKNRKASLSKAEKNEIKKLIKGIKESMK